MSRPRTDERPGPAEVAASGPLRISVAHPAELGPEELSRWRAMQRASLPLASPFLSPDFTLAVSRVRPGARVAVLEAGGTIVGFLPYERRRFAIGRPIGAGVCDRQGVIHVPGLRWDPEALVRSCGLAGLEFDHLLADQAPFRPYHAGTAPTYIMDLGAGYDAYLRERLRASRRSLKTMFVKRRKLESQVGEISFDLHAPQHDVLEALMRWKSGQYRRTGWPDRFAERWVVRLVEDLLETSAAECSGTLSVLRAGGRVVASHFGLRSQSVLCCWFPTYDVRFAGYSPGLLLHLEMARAAAELGVQHLDLGKGEERYKETLRTWELPLAECSVERPSVRALARRLERAPRRYVWGFVLNHSTLRRAARWTLRHVQTRLRPA
jgi:CelD/BcsL family acetyltransferase involved in cellulose biosynthesis